MTTIIGWDLGREPSKTVLISNYPLEVGQVLSVAGQPNRAKVVVLDVYDSPQGYYAEIITRLRPSRGYAKHQRRRRSKCS